MFLAALLIGASALSGGIWSPPGGSDFELRFTEGMNFEMVVEEEGRVRCKTTWPIKSPQATAKCENGSEHRLYFDMKQGVIIFDSIALTKTPDKKK